MTKSAYVELSCKLDWRMACLSLIIITPNAHEHSYFWQMLIHIIMVLRLSDIDVKGVIIVVITSAWGIYQQSFM